MVLIFIAVKPDPLVELSNFLESRPTNAEIIEQLKKTASEFKLDDEQTARLAFMALFPSDVYQQIKTDKCNILKAFVSNAEAQKGVLDAITKLGRDAAVVKVVAHLLKYLYDEDVLEEEPVLMWWGALKSKGSQAKVKEASKLFVEWLE